jgi:hypothetical protein
MHALRSQIHVAAHQAKADKMLGTIPQNDMSIYRLERTTLEMLMGLLGDELSKTVQENTLLRVDSDFTKKTINYIKYIESQMPYLQTLVHPLLDDVILHPNDFEVEPSKAKPESLEQNQALVMRISTQILYSVFSAASALPQPLRNLFASIRATVAQKYPRSAVKTVGAIWFLRWVCPNVTGPDSYGYQFPIDVEARRPLTTLSKTLTKLANRVEFHDQKEQHMLVFNEFINYNTQAMQDYLEWFTSLVFSFFFSLIFFLCRISVAEPENELFIPPPILDPPKTTPLIQAASEPMNSGLSKVNEMLSQADVDVNARDRKAGDTALHYSVQEGNSAITMALLTHQRIDVNLPNTQGSVPLHYAVRNSSSVPLPKQIDIINRLLERGARLDAQNRLGETPLHQACAKGTTEM